MQVDGALTGVLFACLAGLFLGALNITMRRGLARVPDVAAGSAVIASRGVCPRRCGGDRLR